MNTEEIKELLKNVTAPISQIEKKIGMPKSTLQKAISGKRGLSKEWQVKLTLFVEKKQYVGLKRGGKTETISAPKVKVVKTEQAIQSGAFMSDAIKKKLGLK